LSRVGLHSERGEESLEHMRRLVRGARPSAPEPTSAHSRRLR
jgi:hypothetical protein